MQDIHGKLVSEEEVATALGFANVHELRRWQTDLGHKVKELEHQLSLTQGDARNFRRHGERMMRVLEKAEQTLIALSEEKEITSDHMNRLLLAIRVVCGRGVDWNNEVEGLLEGKE